MAVRHLTDTRDSSLEGMYKTDSNVPTDQQRRRNWQITHLVESMATFRHYMGLLARQTEAEREGFEADGAFLFFFRGVVAGNDGEGRVSHGCEGMGV